MSGSNVPFIENEVLRRNLDDAFSHIVTLIPFAQSATYDATAKSYFRKTIIIYTASIIEALLFHLVDTKLSADDLASRSWEIENKVVLYKVADDHEIIGGDYKLKTSGIKKDKMNLAGICKLLKDHKILTQSLADKINVIRELRNSQHIGPHTIVKSFSKAELENAFSDASDVKSFVKTKVNQRSS
jgi:hypothetical protein